MIRYMPYAEETTFEERRDDLSEYDGWSYTIHNRFSEGFCYSLVYIEAVLETKQIT